MRAILDQEIQRVEAKLPLEMKTLFRSKEYERPGWDPVRGYIHWIIGYFALWKEHSEEAFVEWLSDYRKKMLPEDLFTSEEEGQIVQWDKEVFESLRE